MAHVDSSYSGKSVLITGSRRGVGRLIAEHVLRQDGQVLGFARGESTINHPNYHHFTVDIGDADSVVQGFAAVKKVTDKVHILINNAAVLTSQYALIMPVAKAQAMLNTNLLGAFMVSREASKLMRKSGWGRIIHIGSMAVSLEPIGDSIYAASKSGLTTLSNIMAKELAPLNITSNVLSITAIETDMLSQLPKDKIDAIVSNLPIPRYAEPDDVFNILDFLTSERSSYITAQTIHMGGIN